MPRRWLNMHRSRVSGTGAYLPEKRLTNADLEQLVETDDKWITARTGMRSRRIAADGEATSDLALHASQRALEDAGLTAEDLDMILVATVSGDQVMPSTACVLQSKLGAPKVMAFDLLAACTGFLYGLSIADQYVRSGVYKHVLVVGAEVMSSIVNYEDRETCILFGDGAGAWIVSRAEEGEESSLGASSMAANGDLGDLFELPAGGSKMPLTHSLLDENLHKMRMKGREIFKNAVRTMSSACREVLDTQGLPLDQVDWVIPHQANLRILEAVARDMNVPMDKVVVSLEEVGNTSAASIPVAYEVAKEDGRIKPGDNVLLTAFGAGLTSGAMFMKV